MCVERVCGLKSNLKPIEHRLDVVLVSWLVALDNFHTIFHTIFVWCFAVDFEQVLL